MSEYTEGHRERLRDKYIDSSKHFIDDYEILELLLTYSIPRKDVKPVAKDLLNSFGTLDNVLNADIKALINIRGVGERTAVLINLVREINKRGNISRNRNTVQFKSVEGVKDYFNNLLSLEKNEKIVVVTLDNSNRIIAKHEVAEGTANLSVITPKKLLEFIIIDNPSSVIVAHNHPKGNSDVSYADINFTLNLREMLKTIGVVFADHIIVGEDGALSMRSTFPYSNYFKEDKSK